MTELKQCLEYREACTRYRVGSFLDYITGRSENSPVPPGYPVGYPFEVHWRDLLHDLADLMTDDEIMMMIMGMKFFQIIQPTSADAIRERLP